MRRDLAPPPPPTTFLQYKVVELSTVDERTLEDAVNHWTRQGWNLDGVQFAMRESSKRPSMAFVFFTRSVAAEAEREPIQEPMDEAPPDTTSHAPAPVDLRTWDKGPRDRLSDPWARLRRLAEEDPTGGDDDEGGGP